jgi:hypothetical protein
MVASEHTGRTCWIGPIVSMITLALEYEEMQAWRITGSSNRGGGLGYVWAS